MTLYEEAVSALALLPENERAILVASANRWLYDERSPDLDYSESITIRGKNGRSPDEQRAKLRHVFLQRVLNDARRYRARKQPDA